MPSKGSKDKGAFEMNPVIDHGMNPGNQLILIIAAITAGTITIVNLLRVIRSAAFNRTLREAIDRYPDRAEEMIALAANSDAASTDGRTAAVLIAVGLALVAASLIANEGWLRYGIGAALFPLLVGIALLTREFLVRRLSRDRSE
jgi:hypothetical protein